MPGCHQRNPVLKLAPSFRSKFVAWKVAEDLWKSKSHVIHPFIHLSSVYVQMPYYVYIYVCVYIHPSIHPSIHPPTHPPTHPSIHQRVSSLTIPVLNPGSLGGFFKAFQALQPLLDDVLQPGKILLFTGDAASSGSGTRDLGKKLRI